MLAIGKQIKKLRTEKKMTQKELAEILHVTPQAVSKWEREESNPDIQLLLDLSHYFHVSVDELLGNKQTSFFDSLLSKAKGRKRMGNKQPNEFQHTENIPEKQVIIFDIVFSFITDSGLMQTQLLQQRLTQLMKKSNKNIQINTYGSTKVDEEGAKANYILLTPAFGYAKEEIQKKFPDTPIKIISKKDYGMLNAQILYEEIVRKLG